MVLKLQDTRETHLREIRSNLRLIRNAWKILNSHFCNKWHLIARIENINDKIQKINFNKNNL